MSSSASTSTATFARQWKYDVFLNFRGGDVRDKFLSHLREALVRAKLVTFFDEDLRRGEEISPALLKAIEESNVAVPIFSKDYASSTWCLEELVKIMECNQHRGQIVIPVFFDVSSLVVLEQSGIYAEAFAQHKRDKENKRNVRKWKAAMTKAANLAGRSARNTRPEAKLVNEIVNDILITLGRTTDGIDGTVEKGSSGLQKSWSVKVSNTRTVEVQGLGDLNINKFKELPIENLVSFSEPLHTYDVQVTTSNPGNNLFPTASLRVPEKHSFKASIPSPEESDANSSYMPANSLDTASYRTVGSADADVYSGPVVIEVEPSGRSGPVFRLPEDSNANSSYMPASPLPPFNYFCHLDDLRCNHNAIAFPCGALEEFKDAGPKISSTPSVSATCFNTGPSRESLARREFFPDEEISSTPFVSATCFNTGPSRKSLARSEFFPNNEC